MLRKTEELRSGLEKAWDIGLVVQVASELVSIESHRDAPGRERKVPGVSLYWNRKETGIRILFCQYEFSKLNT